MKQYTLLELEEAIKHFEIMYDTKVVLASDCKKAIINAVIHGQFVQMNAHYCEGDEKYIAEYHGSYADYAKRIMEGKE